MTRLMYESRSELTAMLGEAAGTDPTVNEMWCALCLVTDEAVQLNVERVKDDLAPSVAMRTSLTSSGLLPTAPMRLSRTYIALHGSRQAPTT
jgi:hypothetical protein